MLKMSELRPWVIPGLIRNAMPKVNKTGNRDIIAKAILEVREQTWENIRMVSTKNKKQLCRKREFVLTRHLLFFFLARYTPMTLKDIGEWVSPRNPMDHSTVIHGCETIQNLMFSDEQVSFLVRLIEAKIAENTNGLTLNDLRKLNKINTKST